LASEAEQKSKIPFAMRMARSVDGVVDATDELTLAVDGTHRHRSLT
jgi:hypothetical protein